MGNLLSSGGQTTLNVDSILTQNENWTSSREVETLGFDEDNAP